MSDPTAADPAWSIRPRRPAGRTLIELIRAGTLDPTLAATIEELVAGRVPLIVAAGSEGTGATTLLEAFLDGLPPEFRRIDLAGADESFDWLPQATDLGWPGAARSTGSEPIRPESTILVADKLSDHLPAHTWGERARIAVRATAIGYGLAATIQADSLDEVFESLRRPPVSFSEDELSFIGCVVILRRLDGGRRRVAVAHYVRPTVRDQHGHTQRLGPAVLSTWDAARDVFEDFGWGITPELAFRVSRRAGDFELAVEERRAALAATVPRD